MRIVVLGLGYVGLTLAVTLADVGYRVSGIDVDKKKIQSLENGIPTLFEPQMKSMLQNSLELNQIEFCERITESSEETTFIICVSTPVDPASHEPQLNNLNNVVSEVANNLKKQDLVIVRSTLPVGTSRNIVQKTLEDKTGLNAGSNFYLAFAPERTLQGAALEELRKLPQIIGGVNELSANKAEAVFKKVTKTVVKVSSLETAEVVKLLDNTYRDVTISIGNMCGKICDKLKLDAKEVINAANFSYTRNKILYPGPGVGGGCLVKDPYLLLSSVDDESLDLVKTSRKINDSMIENMIGLTNNGYQSIEKSIEDSKVLVLGFAFKGNPITDDIRYSPTIPLVRHLKEQGAIIDGYDPAVSPEQIKSLGAEHVQSIYDNDKYDTVIIMTNNPEFKNLDFKRLGSQTKKDFLVIDGWYLYDKNTTMLDGVRYFPLGSFFDNKP